MSSSKKCLKCKYNARLAGYEKLTPHQRLNNRFCDYIGKTGQKRPCKPGKDCTVFEKKGGR